MALKKVFSPHHGRFVAVGGRRRPDPAALAAAPKFAAFMTGILPTPPAATTYSALAAASLDQMNGNDTLGDCVEAGFNHIDGVWTGNAGAIYVAPLASIISEYSAIGGYVPGNPNTDNGSDEITAVNYYMKTGFSNGDKIIGYLALDATNKTELQLAIYLFENIIYGIELPDAWITPFPSANGFTWDVAGPPDESNGHCPVGVDYNAAGVVISTWAMTGTMTWAANAKYAVPGATGTPSSASARRC